jgi:hypothetical protein
VGSGKPSGKGLVQDPYHTSSKPQHVDIYSVMTYQPLTEYEQQRWELRLPLAMMAVVCFHAAVAAVTAADR